MTEYPPEGSPEWFRAMIEKMDAIEKRKWWQGLNFGCWEKALAIITAIAIILGGFGEFVHGVDAGYDIGCRVGWWIGGCTR